MKETRVIEEVRNELSRARLLYPPFRSVHEGYALILEELEELKGEIFRRSNVRSDYIMRKEATHVAAMAIRFITDLMPEVK